MYATSIGLVIEGMDRYNKEKENYLKMEKPQEVDKETPEKDEEIESEEINKPVSFLKKIQDFFEKDGLS
jgi:hypothetical protein